jgi:hypothetical protein
LIIGGATGGIVALTVKSFADASEKIAAIEKKDEAGKTEEATPPADERETPLDDEVFKVDIAKGGKVTVTSDGSTGSTMTRRVAGVARESLTTLIMLPIQILLISLSSIIVALLYLKTRQAGGENLRDMFSQFEETEHPRKKWQERVRQRLIQSGRITSRP